MYTFELFRYIFLPKRKKSFWRTFNQEGALSQFNGLRFYIENHGIVNNKEITIPFDKVPKDAIASVIIVEQKNNITDETKIGIASIIYYGGEIIPNDLNILPKDFVLIKAKNGKNYFFKLGRDKIISSKNLLTLLEPERLNNDKLPLPRPNFNHSVKSKAYLKKKCVIIRK